MPRNRQKYVAWRREQRAAQRASRKRNGSLEWDSFDLPLPSQLLPMPPATPEKKLLLALLEDAVLCLTGKGKQGGKLLPSDHGRAVQETRSRDLIAEEAARWIMSNNTAPFSFHFVCDHLGLNVHYFRTGASHA